MKIFVFILIFLFAGTLSMINAQTSADKVIGLYHTPKKDGRISIYKKGNKYFGKVYSAAKNMIDSKNPNPSLRKRKMIGTDFITNLIYKDGAYVNGTIYDPQSGKSYDCKMWLTGNKLNVRGFIGSSLFGQTAVFTRVL